MDGGFALLIKYMSDSLSPEERKELNGWRDQSEENQHLFSEVAKLRLINEYNRRNTVTETARGLSRCQATIKHRRMRSRLIQVSKYAAAIFIVVTLSVFAFVKLSSEKYTTISVSHNESVKKIELPDGSKIWISAASELRIPRMFSPSNREVEVKGMAYFDVKKDSTSPFIVHTPYMNIKVTGTSFNLSVENENQSVETILVSGKVILQDNNGRDIFRMSSGEKVIYNSKLNAYEVSSVDVNRLTSWHLNQITFENATLREIVNKLSLIYDVNINLESKELADRRYRCVINKDETLEEVLDILSYLAPIQYKIEGDEVFISE